MGEQQALIVGASGAIGAAVMARWLDDDRFSRVCGVARAPLSTATPRQKLTWMTTSHAQDQIRAIADDIVEQNPHLSRIVIALGTLHGDSYQPEKSLGALTESAMLEVYRVNCVLPLLWVSALSQGLRKSPDCRIAVLSARVGSIGDNRLGGWYSYRSAKAALNMGLRSAAIELGRRSKGVKLLAFHPGTVDSALSKPFQRSVPDGKLFTPDFVAGCLDNVLQDAVPDGELTYVDWAGKTIPW